MKFVLYGGPFDGFEHQADHINEFLDMNAPARPMDGVPTAGAPAPHPRTRYLWCASRYRYEWEGLKVDGR